MKRITELWSCHGSRLGAAEHLDGGGDDFDLGLEILFTVSLLPELRD